MKIAQFADSYKPYISGVTVSIETLVSELERQGHEVKIFAPAYPGYNEKGPKIYRCPSLPTPYPNFRIAFPFYFKAEHLLRGTDIIHSHSPYQMGRLGMRLAKELKIPYVYTFHTMIEDYLHYVPILPKVFTRRIVSRMIRDFCNRCDAIIVPSPKVKHYLLSKGVKRRIEVIPTGIKFELIRSADGEIVRRYFGIGKEDKLLVYVGRLSKEKNIPFLFRAVSRVLRKHRDRKFLIVATGPREEEYKKMARELGIEKQTIFSGQTKPPTIFNYYAAGDIFVFASVTETQGLVVAEAQAAGLPVVAVKAQGVSDVVHEGRDGFLLPQDETAFGKKLELLLKDRKLRNRMAINARKNAQKISSTHMAEKILSLYSELKK